MNYMQYPTQQQYGAQRQMPQYISQPNWNNRIRPVSSVEEVRASSIDFDGSIFYFPDLANKKIYTKQINIDGTATFNVFELIANKEKEETAAKPVYVTRDELNVILDQFKESLASSPAPKTKPIAPPINL